MRYLLFASLLFVTSCWGELALAPTVHQGRIKPYGVVGGVPDEVTPLEEQWRHALEAVRGEPPAEVARRLEERFPLALRLQALQGAPMLPLRRGGGWVALAALQLQVYDAATGGLIPVGNFTAYSNAHFRQLQETYLQGGNLEPQLIAAYRTIAGRAIDVP